MNREVVSSLNIASIGYDTDSQTLEIEFLNGGIYQYFDVPENLHKDLMNADSQGKHLNQNIKGLYRFSKV